MIPALLGLAAAGLGYFGQKQQDRNNQKEAQKNRDFQERMSSTAAQRSRADFEAAGLNPALAYGNTASSPGGAQAIMGSPLEKAGSTAQRAGEFVREAKAAKQARTIEIQDATWRKEMAIAEITKKQKEGNVLETQDRLLNQELHFKQIQQPHDLRRIAAEALFATYQLPGAKHESRLNEKLGIFKPGLGLLLNSSKSLTSALSPWK